MRSAILFLIIQITGLLFFVSCVQSTLQETKPTPAVAQIKPTNEVPGKIAWENEFQRTVEAARKEGKLVVYMSLGSELRIELIKGFGERFGIGMEAISMTPQQLTEKLVRERKAGVYTADVYQGGAAPMLNILKPAGILDSMEPAFILPELKDGELIRKTWWDGKLLWVDPEHKILAFLAFAQDWTAINTDMVKPEEMKSLRDLLNPKWKGKILMFDPTIAGAGSMLFGVLATYITGLDFWREFARQEPVFLRDQRQITEWVARGKYAIAVAPRPTEVWTFQNIGAPIVMPPAPSEGIYLVAGSGSMALINQAPHPNAARLYINWLLSVEGLTIFTRAFGSPSVRLDVPTDFLPADRLRQPGVKYFWADFEEFLFKLPGLYKEAGEIFGIK